MSYGLREAMLCLQEFLADGTSTQYGTVRAFNTELSAYRTEKGLTSAQLPDLEDFTLDQATEQKSPWLWIAPQAGSGEQTPNQHDFSHDLLVGIGVLDSDIDAGWEQALLACASYRDVLFRMLVHRGGGGAGYGPTLNGGGTTCVGAVNRAYATGYEFLEFGDDESGWYGFQVLTRITIDLDEEYPT